MKIKNENIDIWAVLEKYQPEYANELLNQPHKDGVAVTQQGFYGNSLAEIILLGCSAKAAGQVGREFVVFPQGEVWEEKDKDETISFMPEIPTTQEKSHYGKKRPTAKSINKLQEKYD